MRTLILLGLACCGPALAQSGTAGTSHHDAEKPASPTQDNVRTVVTKNLGPVEVQASARSILPTDTLIDSAFGSARSVLDTPRSVTPISAELMRQASVQGLGDLSRVAPDTYTPTGFGTPSLPEIRGQLGELFQDGMRRQGGNNGFGLPLSFNGVEQINVVKGPPPVILGSTQRVGGFVDLISKRPDLDAAGGFARLSTGNWSRYGAQLDYSVPITEGRSAVRVSAQQRNEGSYYDYAHHRSHDLFVAYALKPDDRSRLDANFEYYQVDFTDIAGINRPTQNLIDHGLYITGQGRQPNGSAVPGPFSVISPTGEVKLPRHRVLTDPADTDTAETVLTHLTYQRQLDDGARFFDRAYYQHLRRNEVANNSFVEIIKGADTFENRAELVLDYGHALQQQSDFGVDFRFTSVLGLSQFNTEADNPTDLTGPITNRRIALTAAQRAQLVLLRPGLYVSPGGQYDNNGDGHGDYLLSDSTDSTSYQAGLFYQHQIHFTPQWSMTAGVRGDFYRVSAKDPLPPAGFEPAHDSISRFLPSGNASLTYQPVPSVSFYASYSKSRSTSNSIAGGTPLNGDNRIDPQSFATLSRLKELGVKWAPAGSGLYVDASVFDQTRGLRNRDGSNSGIKTRGMETQLFYQSDQHLFATFGASYLDARYDHSAAYQDTGQVADAFNSSRPDLVQGTGVGSPNFAGFAPSTRRLAGLPHTLVSGLLGYRFDTGFTTSASAVYTGAYPLDFLGTVRVPAEYTLNMAVSYTFADAAELRLDIYNLTNQKNFTPVFDGGYFGATDVFPSEPINAMLSFRYRL